MKQLFSIYSKWSENEGKSSCPKQRNIEQECKKICIKGVPVVQLPCVLR
ncbi:hypothetical protein T12_7857 [Trichinella patagoniensis]|uniref:Uncharacterized protein n=1 Tax=Trichinella patagoniensis TaxID=990121 RepID=A0A0V0YWK9_9BILA|nr:hypothetical protein T12_6955 [Trichinella patagoniensis]KRY04508.1 hypothetical protein T12_7857 [Trichinella patagoniensis]